MADKPLTLWIWMTECLRALDADPQAVLQCFPTPEAVYAADEATLAQTPLPPEVQHALLDKALGHAELIQKDCDQAGIALLTCQDSQYPQRLLEIDRAPALLYVKGTLPDIDEEVVLAMVGSRQASAYGERSARKFAQALALQGVVIVSGIARGIDSASLTGALAGGGRVISVLGNGIDIHYPQISRQLYEDIPKYGGALLSEYPPGTKPEGQHFPHRNRIISGLSLGVLVVEGRQRSGASITAHTALEQNRDVFAIPGNWDAPLSYTPNRLIQKGEAKLVLTTRDMLEEYRSLYGHKLLAPSGTTAGTTAPASKAPSKNPTALPSAIPTPSPAKPKALPLFDPSEAGNALNGTETSILQTLQSRPHTTDELIEATQLSTQTVGASLTMLQIRGLIQEETGHRFCACVRLPDTTPDADATSVGED